MATIKDVAQAAQVSTAAVSRVLNKDDNISVSPEVRARIFQAAHVLGYVSPRQRKAAEHKTHLVIGVADWRIIRPDRHNVRLSSLCCLVQMMTDQYEVTFIRLTFGAPQKVDGIDVYKRQPKGSRFIPILLPSACGRFSGNWASPLLFICIPFATILSPPCSTREWTSRPLRSWRATGTPPFWSGHTAIPR